MLYQHTPQASKSNAFCWLSWPSHINWRASNHVVQAQAKRSQDLEAKRAAGVDPLHVPRLGNSTVDRDPARFSLPEVTRNASTPWREALSPKLRNASHGSTKGREQ